MSQYLSSYEIMDVPSLLSGFTTVTLHAIAKEVNAATTKTKDDEAKYMIRLIRSILGSGRERYVLTALKSTSYFIKVAAIRQSINKDDDSLNLGAIQVNHDMEAAFLSTQFDSSRTKTLSEGQHYDADRHAGILKAQSLAGSIRLDNMIDIKVDYYRELETLRENIDIIEPALSPVLRAARIVYGNSRTLPDGSGLRPLLDAEMVIAIAKYCGDSLHREELFLSLLSERKTFDTWVLETLEMNSSSALARGTL